ncbi:MAG TPA: multidrug transporter [Holosporales bacterium]|nr:multidrug transporter [Holosporales bacterium]
MTYKYFSPFLFSLILSSCTMSPDFMRPDFSAASTWDPMLGYDIPVGENNVNTLDWKDFFKSQELCHVIEIALHNNKDLKLAVLNINEARALYQVERADLLPSLNANGTGSYEKSSDKSSLTGTAQKTEIYKANLGLSTYELDFFGKIRSLTSSALNEYLATQEARSVVQSTLIADTANAYLQLLADKKLLALTRQTLVAQQRTYNILVESLSHGLSAEQDVARAATAVETAKANLHQYNRFVALDRNALFQLMGVANDDDLLPETTLDGIKITENLDPGIPSEVLIKRPDIRQAEHLLLARNADIGAARAAFFPSITLTGSFGYATQSLSTLFTSGAEGAYSFLPQITLPIFQGGRNRAQLDLAQVRKEQAIVAYEKAIQTAFKDVSNQLANRATLDKQLDAQRRLVAAAQKVYKISEARYKFGIDSFLSVLDAQRELYTFQQEEIEIQRKRLSNLVYLYKALGGGAPSS